MCSASWKMALRSIEIDGCVGLWFLSPTPKAFGAENQPVDVHLRRCRKPPDDDPRAAGTASRACATTAVRSLPRWPLSAPRHAPLPLYLPRRPDLPANCRARLWAHTSRARRLSCMAGKCINCVDKPKFGGPGCRKQSCMFKRCNNPRAAPNEGPMRPPLSEHPGNAPAAEPSATDLLVASAALAKQHPDMDEDPLFWTAVEGCMAIAGAMHFSAQSHQHTAPAPSWAGLTSACCEASEDTDDGSSAMPSQMPTRAPSPTHFAIGAVGLNGKKLRSTRCGQCRGCNSGDCGAHLLRLLAAHPSLASHPCPRTLHHPRHLARPARRSLSPLRCDTQASASIASTSPSSAAPAAGSRRA